MKILLSALEKAAREKPAGYLDDVLSVGRMEGDYLRLPLPAYLRLCAKYRQAGDIVEVAAKPIARALRMSCLDENKNLKPESPCARRRNALNAKPSPAPE